MVSRRPASKQIMWALLIIVVVFLVDSRVRKRLLANKRVMDALKKNHGVNEEAASVLISRSSSGVTAQSDVRGNLGPASVVVQDQPGTDWLKDRWQAASDMGGTAIAGEHWVTLDFQKLVKADRVVLDWETAFAELYRLEIRSDEDSSWQLLYDGTLGDRDAKGHLVTPGRSTERSGRSPGANAEHLDLHIVHTIQLNAKQRERAFRQLRLYIVKPAAGWGVSLWQFDVFGSVV